MPQCISDKQLSGHPRYTASLYKYEGDQVKYWLNTVSKEHVNTGIAGGFTQADHGKSTRLKRLAKGDGLVFYSPRTLILGGDKVQAFTAIAHVVGDDVYQVKVTRDFHPWRKSIAFESHVEAPIRPLIDELLFIQDKKRWGFPFRRGLFEIPEQDFSTIARAMAVYGSFFKSAP